MSVFLWKMNLEFVDRVGFNDEISASIVGLHLVQIEHFYFNIYSNALNMLNAMCLAYTLTCWARSRALGQMCKKKLIFLNLFTYCCYDNLVLVNPFW